MKSLYEELNGSYIEIGDVKIPALMSVDTNYEIGFWGQKINISKSAKKNCIFKVHIYSD